MKKFNWRPFFTNFRGERMQPGDSEEQRYQAFKARFLEEQRQAKERFELAAEREHVRIMEEVYGTHGQG